MVSKRSFGLLVLVFAALVVGGRANAGAKSVTCVSTGNDVKRVAGDFSDCEADSDGSNKAIAKAKGSSEAKAFLITDGKAHAVAIKNAFAEAISSSGGNSIAKATNGGAAQAVTSASGKAKATASDNANTPNGGGAHSFASANCTSDASAKGRGEIGAGAEAHCSIDGSMVKATATNGGFAFGSDTDPPDCKPGPGTAKVESPMGNCP